MRIRFLVIVLSLCGTVFPALADTVLVHAGELLTVPGERPLSAQTIVVVDDRIAAVESGYLPTDNFEGNVEVIDLKNRFVLPGLMDMHVHLQGEYGPDIFSASRSLSGPYSPLIGTRLHASIRL